MGIGFTPPRHSMETVITHIQGSSSRMSLNQSLYAPLSLGSNVSLIQSPTRLSDIISSEIATPGNTDIHQA